MVKNKGEKNKVSFRFFRVRWTYVVLGLLFMIIGFADSSNFSLDSNSFFWAGLIVLVAGLLLVMLNKIYNKKW